MYGIQLLPMHSTFTKSPGCVTHMNPSQLALLGKLKRESGSPPQLQLVFEKNQLVLK